MKKPIDESMFEECKWCNGSGDDGTGVCPDCACTGMVGGRDAEEAFDDYVEMQYEEYMKKPLVRVRILEAQTTKIDPLVKGLIGTAWDARETNEGKVVIDACGGILLQQGEYEVIR